MSTDETSDQAGLDRRQLIKRGALLAGAAWTAPMVFDSFASPVAASTLKIDQVGPASSGATPLTVPSNRQVKFELIGGGGGGGGQNSYCGGSGMKVTGTIAGKAGGYTLSWQAAGGGGGGGSFSGSPIEGKSHGGTAGAGYRPGGAGGTATGTYTAGGGGGGGGATAIYSGSALYVYAPGGGGSGGGTENKTTGYGHGNPPTSSTPLNFAGADGLLASGSNITGGKGGSTNGAAVAGGKGYPNQPANSGKQGTTSGGGAGGTGGTDGTGGGGGGGGFCGGGGGGGEDFLDPSGAGGNGSAVRLASAGFTFSTSPTGIAADTSASNARTSGLAAGTPGRCGNGTPTPQSSANGGPGGPGKVTLTFV